MQRAILAVLPFTFSVFSQPQQNPSAPIYQVTVTERTVKAINYQYRNGPTLIDFRGTVLMPKAKGEASVDSKAGRTEIDAHLENVGDPQQFGREYLTYVLWALTPNGRPQNLGEVVLGHSDKSNFRVTTHAQAFAMIVTAEPYSAVRQPSDVVVLENAVRPDTVGKIEQVEARYELLPRGQYSWQKPQTEASEASGGPKVSMRKYEELLQIYQAQNAVGIARSAGAEQYAPNMMEKAQQLLTNAQQLEQSKGDSSRIIQDAREASQTAEDARIIAERQQQATKVEKAESEVQAAQQAKAQAEAETERAREEIRAAQSEAEAAKAQADAERAARERAEADAAARAHPAEPRIQPTNLQAQRSVMRMRLLEQLNGALPARDTPRGLVVTMANSGFNGTELRDSAAAQLARTAAIIAANPGLRIEVEGHGEGDASEQVSSQRAQAVRMVLVAHGVASNSVTARGLGNTRPLASSATAAGRDANQSVEVVIFGDPIGMVPFWDRTYSLEPR